MQARKHQSNILKVLKQSKTQPRIIYTGKIFFKSEGKINISFSNTKKQAEFITSKPVLQEMLKEVLQVDGTTKKFFVYKKVTALKNGKYIDKYKIYFLLF